MSGSCPLEEFYRQLRAGASAVTSQITPVVYEDLFEPVLQAGQDILYIAFSSGLSGHGEQRHADGGAAGGKISRRRVVVIDSPVRLHRRGPAGLLRGQKAEGRACPWRSWPPG